MKKLMKNVASACRSIGRTYAFARRLLAMAIAAYVEAMTINGELISKSYIWNSTL